MKRQERRQPGEGRIRVLEGAAFLDLVANLLEAAGLFRFEVSGNSMHPSICWGDTVTLVAAAVETLNIGDVVLYRGPGAAPILHRVVGLAGHASQRRLQVRGDASVGDGVWIGRAAVVGRVVAVERTGRFRLRPWLRRWLR